MDRVRTFLLVGALAFAAASLVHAGVLAQGFEHREAAIAEGVIGAVLLLGLIVSALAPQWTRTAGLTAQGFALLGTCVGVVMIAIGVGPQSAFDVALHAGFIVLLVSGLIVTARHSLPESVSRA